MLGKAVPNETVANLVKMNKSPINECKDYTICLNSKCKVAYFSEEDMLLTKDIKVPIWYKDDATEKYACYCNRVTIDEVKNATIENNVKNLKELMNYTNVMKNGQCKKNHPFGKCCSTELNKLIEKYKN
ncbi:hypothetical protein HLPR_03860 [Helicovermis profundi]|uniref:(2Fe-2S)-binding protein n=2 Tax=Helicovermis profundi TaxID=3065157 RepID=A0AAU9ESN9_9FIRM|nr:hypothetical protein HLPR_03860 [Clostridia bacterium S502]